MPKGQKHFMFSENGHKHHVLIDKATLYLVPTERKAKGNFTSYVNEAILAMWIGIHSLPDQPGMTRGQMVLAMASDTDSTVSAVVRCACAFYAGRLST